MCADLAETTRLRAALHQLAESVAPIDLRLDPVRQKASGELHQAILWSVNEYAIARLGDLDAPIVAVLVGSTGAGKSTLMNSLAGSTVSVPGAVRPTTRHPVVWCHQANVYRYESDFLSGYGGDGERDLDIVPMLDPMLEGLTLIDAPDVDSVEEVHREIAEELLAAADLCVYVTSAQRYADSVPWQILKAASRRNLPLVFVLNRVPVGAADELGSDFSRRLKAAGVMSDDDSLIIIDEQQIDERYRGLAQDAVGEIRKRLTQTGAQRRRATAEQAVRGAVHAVARQAAELVELIEAEQNELELLEEATSHAYAVQEAEIETALREGTLIRSEVLARWQDFIGTGDFTRAMTEGANRVRSWIVKVFGGLDEVSAQVGTEAEHELVSLVARRADLAASTVSSAWELHPGTSAHVRSADMWRHATETPARAEEAVEDWFAGLSRLIEANGEGKKRFAQAASIGVNAIAVSLMVTVFAHTSGITGTEVGIAAGAAAAQQKLLEHLFGTAAARQLAETARDDLLAALVHVLEADAARFFKVLEPYRMTTGPEVQVAVEAVLSALRSWHV